MTRTHKTLLAAAFAACSLGAQAATVTITFDSPIFNGTAAPGYDAVSITHPTSPGPGSKTISVAAGRFQGTASNLVGIDAGQFVDNINDVWMFCYDVYETIGHGQVVTYTVNFNGATDRTLAFLGAVNSVLGASASDEQKPYAWLHPTTAYEAAAIQLGIWESLYDTGWDIVNGSFKATGLETATQTALGSYFGAIGTASALERKYTMVLEATGAQDMITGDPPRNGVPEPGTLSLLLASAGAFAMGRRRRRA